MRLVLFFFLFFYANSALALSCLNDYAGAAGCAANSSAAGDCETLGFAKTDVAGCTHYLYCPFDTAYKRCVAQKTTANDCSGYDVSPCPEGATLCLSCTSGSTTTYHVVDCTKGYILTSSGSCAPDPCHGYNLIEAPQNASYTTCLSGTKTKFRISSCNSGYFLDNGGTICHPSCNSAYNAVDTTNAFYVSSCSLNGLTKSRIVSCKSGYVIQNENCVKASASDCTGYTLASKPANAMNSGSCTNSSGTKYRIGNCSNGYMINFTGDACVDKCAAYKASSRVIYGKSESCSGASQTKYHIVSCSSGFALSDDETQCENNDCSAYPLKSCPAGGNCLSCQSAFNYSNFYLSSCQAGYRLSGNTCQPE